MEGAAEVHHLERDGDAMRWLRRRWLPVLIALLIAIALACAWLLGPKELTVTFLRFEDGEWGKRWAIWRLSNATERTVFCRRGVYQVQSPEGWRQYPIPLQRDISSVHFGGDVITGRERIHLEERHYAFPIKSGTD